MAKTMSETREWAHAKCREWNWNASPAEVAYELIEAGFVPETVQWSIVEEAFLSFFSDTEDAKDAWRAIGDIVTVFGGK